MITPLVSIVIPCFNQGEFLREAIESCLAQTHSPRDIIVVDDGSTDDTATVAQRYPAVRYLHQPNQGLAAARNAGIVASRGEYVAFLDADDRLKPHAIATNVSWLVGRPELAMVSGDHCYIDRGGNIAMEWTRPAVTAGHYRQLLRGNYIGNCAPVLFRRTVFESIGTFDRSLAACEDYDLYLRVARQLPVGCHDVVVAEYRRYSSTMSDDPARMLVAALTVLRRQKAFVGSNRDLTEAYESGLSYWKSYYGTPLARELAGGPRRSLRSWLRRLMTLLRYAPRESRELLKARAS